MRAQDVGETPWASRGCSRESMRAAILTGPRQWVIKEVALPPILPGQVRVRLEGCGLCASNIVPWQGPDWMNFPTEAGALGHEGWGVIDEVAPDVASINVGDRVAALFHNSFAEYDTGPADAVIALPHSFAGKPFPGEPLGCAMNILARSDIVPGSYVAILGIGFLGALLTCLATQSGARVIALSRREASLALAREMGAIEIIRCENALSAISRVRDLTGGRMCERVIEATGRQAPLDLAGELICEGGRLVIAGYHQDGLRQVDMQKWNWKGIDVINAHERARQTYVRGVRQAISASQAGILPTERLYTHCYPLSDINTAFRAAATHADGFVKALVLM